MNKLFLVILLITLIPITLLAEPKKEESKTTLIVFNLTPEKGVETGAANLLTELVLTEISNMGKYTVIGQNDLDKMLFWETNKQLKNCNDSSCMAQIAGAMGAEYYVIGSIGTMGDNFLINLKLINVLKAVVEKRITEIIKKDENELLKGTKLIVSKLFDVKAEMEPKKEPLITEKPKEPIVKKEITKEDKGTSNKWIGYGLMGTGVVVSAIGGYFTKAAIDADDKYKKSATDAEKYNQEREDNNRNAIISYIGGGALIVGGIVYIILADDKKDNNVKQNLSLNFSGNYLSVGGNF